MAQQRVPGPARRNRAWRSGAGVDVWCGVVVQGAGLRVWMCGVGVCVCVGVQVILRVDEPHWCGGLFDTLYAVVGIASCCR